MEIIQPKNLDRIFAGQMATCYCMCDENLFASARSAGNNMDVCGCYCATDNVNTNMSTAMDVNSFRS